MGIHIYMSYPWAIERPGVRASPYLTSRLATERKKEHEPKSMNKYNTHVQKHML
jgi:Fe-S cluster assembly ATPase SufC